MLLNSIAKYTVSLLKTSITIIQRKSNFDNEIAKKIEAMCDMMDNSIAIIDAMIKNVNDKFIANIKEEDNGTTEKTEN